MENRETSRWLDKILLMTKKKNTKCKELDTKELIGFTLADVPAQTSTDCHFDSCHKCPAIISDGFIYIDWMGENEEEQDKMAYILKCDCKCHLDNNYEICTTVTTIEEEKEVVH